MLIDYLFYDEETGEEFFVETAAGLEYAWSIAADVFSIPMYQGSYTPAEAELMGLDTF